MGRKTDLSLFRQPSRNAIHAGVTLDSAALMQLMPMHILLTTDGRIRAVGPMVRRMCGDTPLQGRSLFSLFEIRGPSRISDIAALIEKPKQKLHLVLRTGAPGLRLRGVAVQLAGNEGIFLNLSFGVDIVRAVGLLQLNDSDFAVTDMAMELLYLAEANAAVMAETRALSTRLEEARLQAEEEALTDPLTGLRNRRACDSTLKRLCSRGEPFTILHLDLDWFKQVNDSYGHAAGDRVLVAVAGILQSRSRATDFLSRVGGDEFVAILPGEMEAEHLRALCDQIVNDVAQPIPYQGQMCRVSGSVGAVIVARNAFPDPCAVMARADEALYGAKQAGRNRIMQGNDFLPL